MRRTTKEMLAVSGLLIGIYLIMLASGIDLRWLLYFVGIAIWFPMVLIKVTYKIWPPSAEDLEHYRKLWTEESKR